MPMRTQAPGVTATAYLGGASLESASIQGEDEAVAAWFERFERRLAVHEALVDKLLQRYGEPPTYGPRQPRISQLRAFEPYLRERLAAFPQLTGRRLHRELRDLGYSGGYTILTELLREIRPVEVSAYEVRFETPPGRQAQVDFAHFRTVFTDELGVERIIWLFSMVLGHSRMLWGRFVLHQDLQTLLRCHTAAFEALGGVPEQVLYDRMRTVFNREDPDTSHIVYNRTLLAFARHYGYLPKACKAYRAKTKGKVERPFRYIRLRRRYPPRGSGRGQVADRWHLLRNLGDAVQTVVDRQHVEVRRVAKQIAEEAVVPAASAPLAPPGAPKPTAAEQRSRTAYARRHARYALGPFVSSLRRDLSAVQAALDLPWTTTLRRREGHDRC